jgi:hypothetical protein
MGVKMNICKGGCGKEAKFGNWCKPFPIHCPAFRAKFNDKRIRKISETKRLQAMLGLNPMQNPEICKKNHSIERNRKASETLKKLGKLGLLPQQTESEELKEKRRRNISRVLRKLYLEGKHPRQRESIEKRQQRLQKMAETLRRLGKEKKLPIQSMSEEEKKKFGKRISRSLRKAFKEGRVKLSDYGRKIPYYSKLSNKKLILRSYWEMVVTEFLDEAGLKWTYEPFSIQYWNSEKKVFAFTVPDFFIPDYCTIIEVKGNGEFNSKKTIDKINGIRSFGFRTFLFGKKEIDQIGKNKDSVLKLLLGDTYEES